MTNLEKSSRSHIVQHLDPTNEMWFCEIIDLCSQVKGTGTNTDSGIWFKSSRSSRVGFGSKIGNQRLMFTFCSHNAMWLSKIDGSCLRFIDRKSMLARECGPNRVSMQESTLIQIWNWITKLGIGVTFMFKFNLIEVIAC